MTDFNFFEPYIGSKKKHKENKLKLYVIIGIFVFAMIMPIYNKFRVMRNENYLQTVSQKFIYSDDYSLRMELEEKITNIEEMEEQLGFLRDLENQIKQINYIDDYLIYTIRDTVPEELFLNEINIGTERLELKGVAKNKIAIAELEYNTRQISYFENIFIPSIQTVESGYSFNIIFNLKGVTEDEIN